MSKENLFLIIGLAGGAALGLLASGSFGGLGSGSNRSAPSPKMDHSQHQMDGTAHDHDRVQEVSPDAVPTVRISLNSEGGCAYNMLLSLENFVLSPKDVNGPHKDGQGHAHLYAGGQKLARVYSEWFHFIAPTGSKSIEVTLNSNDHATLALNGEPIKAAADLTGC